jgi:hypothetical protein
LDRDRAETRPASLVLAADLCFQPSLQPPWQGEAISVRQRSRGFGLKKSETKSVTTEFVICIVSRGRQLPMKVVSAPEHRPPAEVGEEVVRTGLLQGVVVRQCVVHPPEARGDIVGQQYINCIMTPCEEEEYDTT